MNGREWNRLTEGCDTPAIDGRQIDACAHEQLDGLEVASPGGDMHGRSSIVVGVPEIVAFTFKLEKLGVVVCIDCQDDRNIVFHLCLIRA